MAIMYLSNEDFTCPKEQTMHRAKLSPFFADTIYKLFRNSMEPDINSVENSLDPDQLASSEAS